MRFYLSVRRDPLLNVIAAAEKFYPASLPLLRLFSAFTTYSATTSTLEKEAGDTD